MALYKYSFLSLISYWIKLNGIIQVRANATEKWMTIMTYNVLPIYKCCHCYNALHM